MGHRDSSKEQRGAGGVRGIDGGFGAVDQKRLSAAMITNVKGGAGAEDRLKSVPPSASSNDIDVRSAAVRKEGGASPAPTRQSAAVKAALAALRIYKVYLSFLFAGSCRFEPTCSRYTYEAIERFGVIRGSWMGLKRLLRCHPLSRKFGYDPVPEKMDPTASQSVEVEQDTRPSGVASREAHS
jgi:uncharacterized protein